MNRPLIALLAAGSVCLASVVHAQTIRSDSALWTYDNASSSLYPQGFVDDQSFGCVHAINVGVWRYIETDKQDWPEYWRLSNYGVFHCALLYGRADDEAAAGEAFESYAWLARLTEPHSAPDEIELWALQIGVAGGSRYILLRRIGDDSAAPFDVLDAACPRDAERRRANIDIWVQDDCIVDAKADIVRIAQSAANRPPRGRLEFVPQAEGTQLPSQSE